jgi:hypothetical protein
MRGVYLRVRVDKPECAAVQLNFLLRGKPFHRARAAIRDFYAGRSCTADTPYIFCVKIVSPTMILRSAVPYNPTAFHSLLEPLDRRMVARTLARMTAITVWAAATTLGPASAI